MSTIPIFWKTRLKAVDETVSNVKKGSTRVIAKSPGGRNVYLVHYGKKNDLKSTANLSSSLGAGSSKYYADKSGEDYVPTVLLVGATHGGEFEGTSGLLNLISILETGSDYSGEEREDIVSAFERVNLLIIPILNPDGRSHIDFDSFVGMEFSEFRYYSQGTWKDGSLAGWPDCKKVHPIKDSVDFLGGYYNDDGVNFMHDNFFGKKAKETEALFDIVSEYAPDFTILLHGGGNCTSEILLPSDAPDCVKDKIVAFADIMLSECEKVKLPYRVHPKDAGENKNPPASFNLISALCHICGEPCVTYESNQGLNYGENIFTYEQIHRQHLLLFREIAKFIGKKGE